MALTKEDIEKYTPQVRLIRHNGALLFWFQRTYIFRGEPEKIKPALIAITVKNLIFGWWSIVSVFANPVITIFNWVDFNKYTKDYARYVASPEQYIAEARHAEESGQNKKDKRFKTLMMVLIFLAILAAFIAIISIIEAAQPPSY